MAQLASERMRTGMLHLHVLTESSAGSFHPEASTISPRLEAPLLLCAFPIGKGKPKVRSLRYWLTAFQVFLKGEQHGDYARLHEEWQLFLFAQCNHDAPTWSIP